VKYAPASGGFAPDSHLGSRSQARQNRRVPPLLLGHFKHCLSKWCNLTLPSTSVTHISPSAPLLLTFLPSPLLLFYTPTYEAGSADITLGKMCYFPHWRIIEIERKHTFWIGFAIEFFLWLCLYIRCSCKNKQIRSRGHCPLGTVIVQFILVKCWYEWARVSE